MWRSCHSVLWHSQKIDAVMGRTAANKFVARFDLFQTKPISRHELYTESGTNNCLGAVSDSNSQGDCQHACTLGATTADASIVIVKRLQQQSNEKHKTFQRHLKWGKSTWVQCCGVCCDFGSCLKKVTLVAMAISSEQEILMYLRNHGIAPQGGSTCTNNNCPGCMKLLLCKSKKRNFDDMEEEEDWHYLKCSCCGRENNARNEFFSQYKSLRKVMMAIYMMATGFKPMQIKGELKLSYKLMTHMINALGHLSKIWLKVKLCCDMGKWTHIIMDEAMTGQRKYNRGKRACQESAWYMTIVDYDNSTPKVLQGVAFLCEQTCCHFWEGMVSKRAGLFKVRFGGAAVRGSHSGHNFSVG